MLLSIVFAGLVFSPFAGQSGIATYASMRGTVTTGWPNYKPVPNARVVVSGDTDVRETRTDAHGRYTFLTLLPGTYRVSVPNVQGIIGFRPVLCSPSSLIRQQPDAPVELSAGLAYFANFDLFTRC